MLPVFFSSVKSYHPKSLLWGAAEGWWVFVLFLSSDEIWHVFLSLNLIQFWSGLLTTYWILRTTFIYGEPHKLIKGYKPKKKITIKEKERNCTLKIFGAKYQPLLFFFWPCTMQFFTTEPCACEPSSLPKYPPSKEMDAKRRDDEARRCLFRPSLDLFSFLVQHFSKTSICVVCMSWNRAAHLLMTDIC